MAARAVGSFLGIVRAEATRRGITLGQLVAELADSLPGEAPKQGLSFIGAGHSVVATFHVVTVNFVRNRPLGAPLTTSDRVSILVDTGVLLGAIDADDAAHADCSGVLARHAAGGLLVPITVIAAVAQQLENDVGATLKRHCSTP